MSLSNQVQWTESGFLELIELTFGREATNEAREFIKNASQEERDDQFYAGYLKERYPEFVRAEPLLCE